MAATLEHKLALQMFSLLPLNEHGVKFDTTKKICQLGERSGSGPCISRLSTGARRDILLAPVLVEHWS